MVAVIAKTAISWFTCPEKAVLFSFFADSRRKKGFQPVKNLYFCVGQQKKRAARKEPVKRTAILEYVNQLYLC